MTKDLSTTQQQTDKPYIIDPEFKSIFSKTKEQYEDLKETIRKDGKVRDPLAVWDEENILVDGHGRDQICDELDFEPPPIVRMSFESRDDAKMWILNNQFVRRNLNTFQRIEAALQVKEFFMKKARANQRAGVSMNSGKGIVVDEELAKLAKTSPDSVGKVIRILAKSNEPGVAEAINALRNDEDGVSIHSVYQKYCGKPKPAPSTTAPKNESAGDPVPKQPDPAPQDNSAGVRLNLAKGIVGDNEEGALSDLKTTYPVAMEKNIRRASRELRDRIGRLYSHVRGQIELCSCEGDCLYFINGLEELLKKVRAKLDEITSKK